ncbi:MAG: cell division protein SepF [Actinomycetota bacterium]
MWRRAMLYLGLGPDDEYDEYDAHDDHGYQAAPQQPAYQSHHQPAGMVPPGPGSSAPPGSPVPPGPPGPQRQMASEPVVEPAIGAVRPMARDSEPAVTVRPRPSVVRPIQPSISAKPYVVSPTSFNEAQEVADKFKGNQPVIVNLQGAERDLSRRLIDFASGLCYGLGGQMDKVANQVYLLTPSNVEVSAEEKRRLQERGLYDS